jgi:hypothetical protein
MIASPSPRQHPDHRPIVDFGRNQGRHPNRAASASNATLRRGFARGKDQGLIAQQVGKRRYRRADARGPADQSDGLFVVPVDQPTARRVGRRR